MGRVRRFVRYLPALVLGRPLRGVERYRPFFIVGSGRCGTTLLRAMLEAHPDVHIPPENDLRAAIRAWRTYSRLPWNAVLRLVLGRFEFHPQWERWELSLGSLFQDLDRRSGRARTLATVLDALYRAHLHRHKPSALRWGDKTPSNVYALASLRAVFPDLRVVQMVRDGRDVVGSCLRIYDDGLTSAAEKWVRAVHTGQRFGARHPGQYLEVRYEALVREPRATLQRVGTFLDVPFEERMLHYHELGLKLGDVERIPHMQGVRQPIHGAAVGRWRTQFTPDEIRTLDRLLGPTLADLGYDG